MSDASPPVLERRLHRALAYEMPESAVVEAAVDGIFCYIWLLLLLELATFFATIHILKCFLLERLPNFASMVLFFATTVASPVFLIFFSPSIFMLERFQVLLPSSFIFATSALVFATILFFDFFAGSIILLEPL
ncbi:hypothetical protein VPH35_075894 [Triticum aestivum]